MDIAKMQRKPLNGSLMGDSSETQITKMTFFYQYLSKTTFYNLFSSLYLLFVKWMEHRQLNQVSDVNNWFQPL